MKKFISILLSITLISLVACGTGTSTAKLEIIPEGTELSGVLEISSFASADDSSHWWNLAQGFMKLHPNVEIVASDTITNSSPLRATEQSILEKQQYIADLRIRLISGDAPDLIFGGFEIISDFAPSDVLWDLNEYIENDETFIEEDFYMNVIRAGEIGGELVAIPIGFYDAGSMRFNTDMLNTAGISLEGLEDVDYKFVMDTYEELIESGKFPELKSVDVDAAMSYMLFLLEEMYACIDFENFTANFDTENFRNYLETMKAYMNTLTEIGESDKENDMFEDGTYFAEIPLVTLYDKISLYLGDYENASKLYPMVSTTGEHIIYTYDNMAIPKNAENPELAWEFIKYCTYESEKVGTIFDYEKKGHWDGDRFDSFLPINKGNLEKYLEVTLVGQEEYFSEKMITYMDEIASYPTRQFFMFNTLMIEISEIVSYDYYRTDLIDTDECIKLLQDKAKIYFAEMK